MQTAIYQAIRQKVYQSGIARWSAIRLLELIAAEHCSIIFGKNKVIKLGLNSISPGDLFELSVHLSSPEFSLIYMYLAHQWKASLVYQKWYF